MDQSTLESSTSDLATTLGKFRPQQNRKFGPTILVPVKSSGNSGNSTSLTIDNLNIFDSITNLYSQLNLVETLCLVHISGFIVITLSMLSILNIFYGEKVINYFSLEDRWTPKVSKDNTTSKKISAVLFTY